MMMILGPVAIALGLGIYFIANARFVSTDNAYIRQNKVSVSAEVGGRIVEVAVRENQRVRAGDLLFRIDPEPYQLAVQEAQAAVASARASLEELQTVLDTSNVAIDRAEGDIAYYEREYQRQLDLMKTNVTTEAAVQAAAHSLAEAKADLASAQADAARARAALSTGGSEDGVNPRLRAAQVQLDKAQLNLSRTAVRAPVSGIVSQSDRLQVGQLMVQGLPAVTIVDEAESWVEANFKETNLRRMQPGQSAVIHVDTYPDLALEGTVQSIGAGTGSEFSILPAQNANANWVKVTQRVPVRIAIDKLPDQALIAGLSVHVRVDTGS